MKNLVEFINRLNVWVGKAIAWLVVFLVLLIVFDVVLRYLFNIGSVANAELEWHLFGAIILLGLGYAYQQDRHVRVDVFYQRFSPKQKEWVNLIGTAIFLLPFCMVAAYKSWPFVMSSFTIQETSPDPGGLPARYIIKSAIPIGFVLLGLQGIAKMIESLQVILRHD
ncbi:MAG: TRAP transporter small permease subunit [Bacteroidota bacterium]